MEAKFKAYIGKRGKPIWEKESARAAAYSIIRTVEKQVPAIEGWMTQDYRMKLVTAMKAGIVARTDKQTARTEAAGSTIPSMKLIREVLQQMGARLCMRPCRQVPVPVWWRRMGQRPLPCPAIRWPATRA